MATQAEFDGIVFAVHDADIKSYSSRARYNIIRIPGGDRSILQRNPTGEHTLSADYEMPMATVEALRAKVGSFGTYTCGPDSGSALLLSVEPKRIWRYNYYIVSLSLRFYAAYGVEYGVYYGS